MALTFTSWTDYTDDLGDPQTMVWDAVADVRGTLLRPRAEAIRQAVIERGATKAPLSAIPGAIAANELPTWEFARWVDYWVGVWIVEGGYGTLPFVNHTDNGGDWDGLAASAFAPVWTSAAILADIAPGTTRITAADNGPMTAAWCWQAMQLLDRLRWRKRSAAGTLGSYTREGYNGTHEDDTIVEAVDYAIAHLGDMSGSLGAYTQANTSGSAYIGRAHRQSSAYSWSGIGATPACSRHVYARTPSAATWNAEWDAVGTMFAVQDRMYRTEDAAAAASDTFTSATLGAYGSSPWPVYPSLANKPRGWRVSSTYLVCKFDCAGGYTFVT